MRLCDRAKKIFWPRCQPGDEASVKDEKLSRGDLGQKGNTFPILIHLKAVRKVFGEVRMSQRPNLHRLTGRCRSRLPARRPDLAMKGQAATLTKTAVSHTGMQWHLWSVPFSQSLSEDHRWWYPLLSVSTKPRVRAGIISWNGTHWELIPVPPAWKPKNLPLDQLTTQTAAHWKPY